MSFHPSETVTLTTPRRAVCTNRVERHYLAGARFVVVRSDGDGVLCREDSAARCLLILPASALRLAPSSVQLAVAADDGMPEPEFGGES